MKAVLKTLYKLIFRGTSGKVVAPPGKLSKKGGGRPIVVASFPRSGTHLLIDAILNNFPNYAGSALYLDFDQMSHPEFVQRSYDHCHDKSVVVKTHYPHRALFTHERSVASDLEKVSENAIVILVKRHPESILKSYQSSFGELNIEAELKSFYQYWQGKANYSIDFDTLTDSEALQPSLEELSTQFQLSLRKKFVPPPQRNQVIRTGILKAMTRLLGYRSPLAFNTTIQFKG